MLSVVFRHVELLCLSFLFLFSLIYNRSLLFFFFFFSTSCSFLLSLGNIHFNSLFCFFLLSSIICSIVGIYISIISVVASFIRGQLFGTTNTIMFDELPQVDALWNFLNDIYLLRIVREFPTENDYFDRLIYIYRNPQVLLYWTREKTEKK